jgi:Chs5-Arf1p-binding protein BUD7/BCH1
MEEEYRMQKTLSDIQQVSLDDQVSIRGIKSPSPTAQPVSIADVNGNDSAPVSAVPTIRISTDSSQENDSKEEENGQEKSANHDKDDTGESELESKDIVDRRKEKGKAKEVVQESLSFSNKRLCERWLDNLFMVLYEVRYSSFLLLNSGHSTIDLHRT